MDRAEAAGLGVATTGHLVLLAALMLGFAAVRTPPMRSQPIEVSFVADVGLTAAAPQPVPAPPEQSAAPEAGPPEQAAPQPAETVVPPAPAPEPAPLRPRPRPAPVRPGPAPQESAAATPVRPAPAPAQRPARRPGPLPLDPGSWRDPAPSQSQAPPAAAVMSAEALAGIQAAIARQIQPCANRQVDPGPGANQIRVTLNLRLARDGSLAATPSVSRTSGVTAQNGRYEARVKDLAVAAYVGCSPLRGLPDELYRTPKGGWSNINMTYRLPGSRE